MYLCKGMARMALIVHLRWLAKADNVAQRLEIHLGVHCGAVRHGVQQISDIFCDGSAVANHCGCETVAEEMGRAATRAHAGPGEYPAHNVTHGGRTRQATARREHLQEDRRTGPRPRPGPVRAGARASPISEQQWEPALNPRPSLG